MTTQDGPDREQVRAWVERVAMFVSEEWGLAPIAGRVLGWLMACDPPAQTAGDIAGAIGASRASLTTNMHLLTSVRLVRRFRRPGSATSTTRSRTTPGRRSSGRSSPRSPRSTSWWPKG
ncbi:GbsR/MarR family transcriptional regulator [Nonomuraea thailandensis]